MTDKARELLERALEQADYIYFVTCEADTLAEEIRAYLAEPEVKRDAAFEAMKEKCPYSGDFRGAFYDGWLCAEKHHGIGGDDDKQS